MPVAPYIAFARSGAAARGIAAARCAPITGSVWPVRRRAEDTVLDRGGRAVPLFVGRERDAECLRHLVIDGADAVEAPLPNRLHRLKNPV